MHITPARVGLLLGTSLLVAMPGVASSAAFEPLPGSAAAADCNAVAVGVADFSGGTFRYGRWRGQAPGGTGLLDLLLCRALAPGEGGARHAKLQIEDATLSTRRAQLVLGRQGVYRFEAGHQGLPQPRTLVASPFTNPGSTTLVLPPDWIAAPTTEGMTRLLPSLGELALGVDRRRQHVGVMAWLGERWQVDTRYAEDRRQGLRGIAGLIGNTGGNPRVAMLPEPVDQTTRDADLGIRYVGERWQMRAGVLLSRFDSAHSALSWQNPFSSIAGWDASAGHPGGFGQAGLMPANRFSQISVSTATSIGERTRFNADVALGRLTQDQAFLPYTVNPELAAGISQGLPRASLDGRVDTRLLNLRVASRPSRRSDWLVSYRFDERDNRTPRDEYVYIGGDSQQQDASEASSRRRFNLPVGHRQQRLRAEAGYRNGSGVDGRAGIEHRRLDRTWSARSENDETLAHIVVRARPSQRFTAGTRIEHGQRGGSTYLGSRPFRDSYAEAYTDTVPGGFENLPGLRQYHLADRERWRGSAFVQIGLGDTWQVGMTHAHTRDAFKRSEFGLQHSRIRDAMLDVAWVPPGPTSVTGFFAREHLAFRQSGRAFSGGPARVPTAADPARDWLAVHDDRVTSMGLGLRHAIDEGRLRLGIDAARTRVDARVHVATGPALASAPLPESRSTLDSVDLVLDLRLQPRHSLRLRYRMEHFRGADWSTDDVGPAQLANVILLGEAMPDYRARALLLSWYYRF